MIKNKIKCDSCKYASQVTKITIRTGIKREKQGFVCCHESKWVEPDKFFAGKTSPRWCPLKNEKV